MFIFLGLFILSWMVYTVFYFRLKKELVFLLKMMTSLLLFLFAFLAVFESRNSDYSRFIIVGLGMGILGDLFLGLQRLDRKRKHLHLALGIASFSLGHIFYSFAFQRYAGLPFYVYLPLAVIILLLSLVFIRKQKLNFGKAKKILLRLPLHFFRFFDLRLRNFLFRNQPRKHFCCFRSALFRSFRLPSFLPLFPEREEVSDFKICQHHSLLFGTSPAFRNRSFDLRKEASSASFTLPV